MGNPNWNDNGDDWTTAADWSTGVVPGAGDNVTVAVGNPQIESNVGTVASVTASSGITIFDGALATTGFFTINNMHFVGVDDLPTGGGSTLDVGGALTVSGDLFIGNTTLGAATTVDAASLSVPVEAAQPAPALTLIGSATNLAELKVGATAGFGTMGLLTGSVSLMNDAAIQFTGGQIGTIDANSQLLLFGAGAQINDANGTTPNSAFAGAVRRRGKPRCRQRRDARHGGLDQQWVHRRRRQLVDRRLRRKHTHGRRHADQQYQPRYRPLRRRTVGGEHRHRGGPRQQRRHHPLRQLDQSRDQGVLDRQWSDDRCRRARFGHGFDRGAGRRGEQHRAILRHQRSPEAGRAGGHPHRGDSAA